MGGLGRLVRSMAPGWTQARVVASAVFGEVQYKHLPGRENASTSEADEGPAATAGVPAQRPPGTKAKSQELRAQQRRGLWSPVVLMPLCSTRCDLKFTTGIWYLASPITASTTHYWGL
jgi:hypothetical protein